MPTEAYEWFHSLCWQRVGVYSAARERRPQDPGHQVGRRPLLGASRFLLLILLLARTLVAQQEVKPVHVGSQVCQGCHTQEFADQSTSGHAGALHQAAKHPLAGLFSPALPLRRGQHFRFDFQMATDGYGVRVSGPQASVDIPIEWAFGSGEQAVTFVSRISKDWYLENYFSYYAAIKSLGPTPGQEILRPEKLEEAVGLLYKTTDPNTGIVGCFECHSTGPVSIDQDGEVLPAELGVRCEVCHGPGSLHVKTGAKQLILNPKRMSASQLNEFCGRCHRAPGSPGTVTDWNNEWNIRHQPIYLSQSACFSKSQGALSCLTCHQPHEALRQNDASFYAERCLACHDAQTQPPAPVCETASESSCIDCHMPRVSPQAYLQFTNHWIGVYGAGAKLRPVR